MGIVVFSKRGVHVKQGKSDFTGLYVPSADEILTYRDIPANTAEVAQRMGKIGSRPLWREERGQAVVYGLVPNELGTMRQALQVWLASDFTREETEAFFFLFDRKWLVHGVKEIDDEQRHHWRTTMLQYTPETIFQAIADEAGDLLLNGNRSNIIIAVDGDLQGYGALRDLLSPLNLSPLPFSTLKPNPRSKVLHRQRDYTLLMMISLFFFIIMLGGVSVWWLLGKLELSGLNSQIAGVRSQIEGIQINESLDQVQNPEEVIKAMARAFNQQPSAIVDAAGRVGAAFGTLSAVQFPFTQEAAADGTVPDPSRRVLTVETSDARESLLVNQEKVAKHILPQLPWVRQLRSLEQGNGALSLRVDVQIDSPEGENLVSDTSVVEDVTQLLPASVEELPDDPSSSIQMREAGAATSEVSDTLVSPTIQPEETRP